MLGPPCSLALIIVRNFVRSLPPCLERDGHKPARGALASFLLMQNFLDTLVVNATDFVLTDFATRRQLILLQECLRVKCLNTTKLIASPARFH